MSRLLLLLLFALVSGSVWAVPQGPVIGKVTLLLGSVTAVDQDGDSVELKRGADLRRFFAGYRVAFPDPRGNERRHPVYPQPEQRCLPRWFFF